MCRLKPGAAGQIWEVNNTSQAPEESTLMTKQWDINTTTSYNYIHLRDIGCKAIWEDTGCPLSLIRQVWLSTWLDSESHRRYIFGCFWQSLLRWGDTPWMRMASFRWLRVGLNEKQKASGAWASIIHGSACWLRPHHDPRSRASCACCHSQSCSHQHDGLCPQSNGPK